MGMNFIFQWPPEVSICLWRQTQEPSGRWIGPTLSMGWWGTEGGRVRTKGLEAICLWGHQKWLRGIMWQGRKLVSVFCASEVLAFIIRVVHLLKPIHKSRKRFCGDTAPWSHRVLKTHLWAQAQGSLTPVWLLRGGWGPEKLCNLPKDTQLGKDSAWALTPGPASCSLQERISAVGFPVFFFFSTASRKSNFINLT